MRRVVSLFLPTWPTDRLRRHAASGLPPASEPLVTSLREGSRRVVASADAVAYRLGLRPGLTIAQAQAMLPGLAVIDADIGADRTALRHLALWCRRYTPMTAPHGAASVFLDITGCAHLFGGEAPLLADLLGQLAHHGSVARAAIADTPGAAYAVARFGRERVIAPCATAAALSPLPVAALRLPPMIAAGLDRLGLERVGLLAAAPRAPLARRFGPIVGLRLDQALGHVFEPIEPVLPQATVRARLGFVEPVVTVEGLRLGIDQLVARLCRRLLQAGLGARQLDLLFLRVDALPQSIRIGTATACRDPAHLARLLAERLETVDPGFGVESMRLAATLADRLPARQLGTEDARDARLSGLIDRLASRFGAAHLYRAAAQESDVPERSVARVPPLAPPTGRSWPASLPRPSRLLSPPEPVQTMALLPDHPPRLFVWRRHAHRICRADGPERIFGEWWQADAEIAASRDYFHVEDEAGSRFWLFRTAGGLWFLHGIFG